MTVREIISRIRYGRRPSRRIRAAVQAVLTDIGLGDAYLVEDMAGEIGREMARQAADRSLRDNQRVTELLEANSREVERRRLAERVIGQLVAFVTSQDKCNAGDAYGPGVRVILQTTGYSPTP